MRLSVEEAVRVMAMRSGKKLAQICRDIGCTPQNVNNMIARGSLRMKYGAMIAGACGYKLMLIPEETEVEGIEIKGEVE